MCARGHMCVGFNTNYGGLGLRLLFCFLRQGSGARVKQIRLELTGITDFYIPSVVVKRILLLYLTRHCVLKDSPCG